MLVRVVVSYLLSMASSSRVVFVVDDSNVVAIGALPSFVVFLNIHPLPFLDWSIPLHYVP